MRSCLKLQFYSQAGDIILDATEQIKVEPGSQILNDVNPLATGNSGKNHISPVPDVMATIDSFLAGETYSGTTSYS